MPIDFAPRRGAILMCDFGRDPREPIDPRNPRPEGVVPEMTKVRRAVVVSADLFNVRGSRTIAGLCTVVPLSGTETIPANPAHLFIPDGRYRSVTMDVWAKCNLVQSVSHDRLERPRMRGHFVSEWVSKADLALIEDRLRLVFGL